MLNFKRHFNITSLKSSTNPSIEDAVKNGFIVSPSTSSDFGQDLYRNLVIIEDIEDLEDIQKIRNSYNQSLSSLYSNCVSMYFAPKLGKHDVATGGAPIIHFSKKESGDIIATITSDAGTIKQLDDDFNRIEIAIPGEVTTTYQLVNQSNTDTPMMRFTLESIEVNNSLLAAIVMGQNTPFSFIQLTRIKTILIDFLNEKRTAGSGRRTRKIKTQNNRIEYIDQIIEKFDTLIKNQTTDSWVDLLKCLTKYRIDLYTEHKKEESTFGDALTTVHRYLLTFINQNIEKDPMFAELCEMRKLTQNDFIKLLESEGMIEENNVNVMQARINAAALGNEESLSINTKPAVEQEPAFEEESSVGKRKRSQSVTLWAPKKKEKLEPYPAALYSLSNTRVDEWISNLQEKIGPVITTKHNVAIKMTSVPAALYSNVTTTKNEAQPLGTSSYK